MNHRAADFWEAVIAFVVGSLIITLIFAGVHLSLTTEERASSPNPERTDHAADD